MECKHCRKGCPTSLGDKCIQYTGGDIPELGISRGMWLDEVLFKIGTALVSHMTKKVSLNSLAKDGDTIVPIDEGLQVVLDKVSTLSTDDISYTSSISAVNSSAVAPLMNKSLSYSTHKTSSGTSFGWDLTNDLQDLPNGYRVTRTRAVAHGDVVNSSSILFDSNKPIENYLVRNDRFPMSVSMSVYVRTPNGDAILTKDAYISAPETNSYRQIFNIKDNTNKVANASNLTELAETLQKQTDLHNSKISNIEQIKVNGVSGIESVLQNFNTKVDEQSSEINSLKQVEYKEGDVLKKGSAQEYVDSTKSTLDSLSKEVSSLKNDVETLKQ